MVQHFIMSHLHDAGTAISYSLDGIVAVGITVLLMLRLFQWQKAGKAILPLIGVYVVLKVILP